LFDVGVVFVVVDDATVGVIDVVFMGFSAGERSFCFCLIDISLLERESNLGGCYGRLGF